MLLLAYAHWLDDTRTRIHIGMAGRAVTIAAGTTAIKERVHGEHDCPEALVDVTAAQDSWGGVPTSLFTIHHFQPSQTYQGTSVTCTASHRSDQRFFPYEDLHCSLDELIRAAAFAPAVAAVAPLLRRCWTPPM